MNPSASSSVPKRFLLNFMLFSTVVLIVSFLCSQYMAYQFDYHASLGGEASNKIYWPWMWALWSWQWSGNYPALVKQTLFLFSGGLAAAFFVYGMGVLFLRRGSKGVEGLHGTARWARKNEIIDAGLLQSKEQKKNGDSGGVYVGGWVDPKGNAHYLRHSGAEHILAFAPTRSGKGVGLVLPTLLSWPHSVLCYDIKGENWALTAGWRKEKAGNIVMKFDPASDDGSSVSFNPLAEIDLDSQGCVAEAQNIAFMLVDPDGKGLEDHWAKTSHALLTACILHICFEKKSIKKQANLQDVADLLADPQRDTATTLDWMLKFEHQHGKPHPVVAAEARSMLNKEDKERSSIISTALSYLTLFRDPIVSKNTSFSGFKINDLMNNEKPVSLYLVVKPSDAERLRPLIRLMVTQIVRTLTRNMAFEGGRSVKGYDHQLLLLLDEFASLKKLNAIEDGLAFMAGYGLKAYLIVQDLEQINSAYGEYEGLLGNCHVKVAYAPNKLKTAEVISKMTGTTTIIKKQTTVSGDRHDLILGNTSETYQEVSRPLMTPDEVMRLPGAEKAGSEVLKPGDMLIFVAGFPAIYGQQILYFKDPVFLARAQEASVARSEWIYPRMTRARRIALKRLRSKKQQQS